MTATNTPRLGLMSPVDSDLFLSADFATTNAKLDGVPGTFIAANYAALSSAPYSTWTTAQNGNRVLQLDTGAEWYWNAGSFKRLGALGLLKNVTNASPVSTTLITAGPTFNSTGNFTVVGGRALRIDLEFGADNSSGASGQVIISVFDNAVQLADLVFKPGTIVNSAGIYNNISLFIPSASITPNSTHNISASVRSSGFAVGAGGHGTSVVRTSVLNVTEI